MSNGTEDFIRDFEAPNIVVALQDSPRFGRSDDISALFGSSAESDEYTKGLIAAACVTAICFFVAFLCLPILMCLGQGRVGFLSGAPLKVRSNRSSTNVDDDEQSSMNSFNTPAPQKLKRSTVVDEAPQGCNCCLNASPTGVRATFITSGVIFILFAILLVTQGVTNLQDTIYSVNLSASEIDALATEADDILQSGLLDLQTQATSVRDGIVTELSGDTFCPADPTLENYPDAANIRNLTSNAEQLLSQLDTFLAGKVEGVSEAIDDAAKGARQVKRATDDVDLLGWKTLFVLIPYTIIPCLLVSAAIMAHFDADLPLLNTLVRWFLMPLFVIMVIVCAGVASGMIAAASANSDFCLPGGRPSDTYPGTTPDTTVWRVLDRKQHTPDQLLRQVADFYIDQCQNKPDPFVFLREYVPPLIDSREKLNELLTTVLSNEVLVQLSLHCNRSYDNVDELVVEMNEILDVVIEAIQRTINLLECDRIVPIYHRAVYDSSCTYSVSAVFWVFSAALIMGAFGLLMILFRSACKPTLYNNAVVVPDLDERDSQLEHVVYDDGRAIGDDHGADTPDRKSLRYNQGSYSPNKSSIYIEDSPGRY